MARTAPEVANPTSHRRFGLTEEEIFCLWKTAITDDEKLIDEIIRSVYDDLVSFDRQRTEIAMNLTIRRHRDAQGTLRSLLDDLRKRRHKNFSFATPER
jgi:hypothetical protein